MGKETGDKKAAGKGPAAKTYGKKAGDFPKAYIRLRTVLDGLEISALRFCLDDKNLGKRLKRMAELEEILMPIIKKMQDKTILPDGPPGVCGEGLYNCGGVCVPYQCPSK